MSKEHAVSGYLVDLRPALWEAWARAPADLARSHAACHPEATPLGPS